MLVSALCYTFSRLTLLGKADDHELLTDISAPAHRYKQLANILFYVVHSRGNEHRWLCLGAKIKHISSFKMCSFYLSAIKSALWQIKCDKLSVKCEAKWVIWDEEKKGGEGFLHIKSYVTFSGREKKSLIRPLAACTLGPVTDLIIALLMFYQKNTIYSLIHLQTIFQVTLTRSITGRTTGPVIDPVSDIDGCGKRYPWEKVGNPLDD